MYEQDRLSIRDLDRIDTPRTEPKESAYDKIKKQYAVLSNQVGEIQDCVNEIKEKLIGTIPSNSNISNTNVKPPDPNGLLEEVLEANGRMSNQLVTIADHLRQINNRI